MRNRPGAGRACVAALMAREVGWYLFHGGGGANHQLRLGLLQCILSLGHASVIPPPSLRLLARLMAGITG